MWLRFTQALDLGRGANPTGYMVEEIWEELSKAKYMEWELISAGRSWELNSLKQVLSLTYSSAIILLGTMWLYGTIHLCLRETCEAALNQQRALDMSRTEECSHESYSAHTEQLKALERVFEKAAEEDKPTEVALTSL